jgi:hypothetical protein
METYYELVIHDLEQLTLQVLRNSNSSFELENEAERLSFFFSKSGAQKKYCVEVVERQG